MRRLLLWFGAATGLAGHATFAGDLPNPNLTPGMADPALTVVVLCAPGFSPKTIRNVPTARKKAIYRVYAIASNQAPCPCEIDHLIPLGIGGSNGPRNLWPQPESTVPWNSKLKDQLEIQLRTEVCAGTTDLLASSATRDRYGLDRVICEKVSPSATLTYSTGILRRVHACVARLVVSKSTASQVVLARLRCDTPPRFNTETP